jgi:hypothetical protein
VLHVLARRAAPCAGGRAQLVDLVDEDDAPLTEFDAALGLVVQPIEDRLDLVVDVANCARRRIGGYDGT